MEDEQFKRDVQVLVQLRRDKIVSGRLHAQDRDDIAVAGRRHDEMQEITDEILGMTAQLREGVDAVHDIIHKDNTTLDDMIADIDANTETMRQELRTINALIHAINGSTSNALCWMVGGTAVFIFMMILIRMTS